MNDNERNDVFNEDKGAEGGIGEFAAGTEPRIDGEYSFTPHETTRTPYSDAGYVPSTEASAVPPRYPTVKEKKVREKKERRGMSAAAVISLCLVCAILGGLGGGAISGAMNRSEPAPQASPTVINMAVPTTTVATNTVSSAGELSPQELYELACRQTVAITTEITYYNIFGYASSSAVSGSGFIISSNGYILTNHHVIEEAAKGGYEVKVLLHDGSEYVASIVGYEAENDVAVLKIEAEGLSAVTIGDSDNMKVGDSVYAVGNPLGELQYTMTGGMVSALDREITSTDSSTGQSNTINMFQMDAAVNSGNSGGPVFNSRGEVVGIVTAKYSTSGVEGLGFAIPINDGIYIANELMTNGYVSGKAYMGITADTVTASIAQYYHMVEGAYVYAIEPGSCAEECGLKVGDIIVAMDGKEIKGHSELIAEKKDYHAGDSAVLKVYRGGEYLELTIVFDEEIPQSVLQPESEEPTYGYSGGPVVRIP